MKRHLALVAAVIFSAVFFSSCGTLIKSAKTIEPNARANNITVADLDVADERVSYTLKPSKEVQHGGLENVKQTAEADVLKEHNADVLLEPRYVVNKKRTLFGNKITSVTVSGCPAYYKNYRSLSDSVWSNPVFRSFFEKTYTARNSIAKRNVAHSSLFRKRGFEGYVSLAPSYYWHYDEEDEETYSDYSINLLANYGYRFNSHFFIGIGTGFVWGEYKYDSENFSIPIYLDSRVDFFNTRNTLFAEFMAGTYFCGSTTNRPFFGFSMGYSLGNVDFAIRYLRQHKHPIDVFGSYEYEECVESIGLSLGYRF
ncbi:MAG: hypothetical protein IJY64_01315 [Bacteroidaceae bacterium]|nr:hypothetical protein [Bacteroidaceae bacterium]